MSREKKHWPSYQLRSGSSRGTADLLPSGLGYFLCSTCRINESLALTTSLQGDLHHYGGQVGPQAITTSQPMPSAQSSHVVEGVACSGNSLFARLQGRLCFGTAAGCEELRRRGAERGREPKVPRLQVTTDRLKLEGSFRGLWTLHDSPCLSTPQVRRM